MQTTLNNSSRIPLAWLWGLLGAFATLLVATISLALWLGSLADSTKNNTQEISYIKTQQSSDGDRQLTEMHSAIGEANKVVGDRLDRQMKAITDMALLVREVDRRTSRIEGHLERSLGERYK